MPYRPPEGWPRKLAYRKFEIPKFAKKKILFDRILAILSVKGPPIFIVVWSWP
jgi:hypothetical protein